VTSATADRPELRPQYVPQAVEGELYERWVERGYFTPTGEGTPYTIVIPPPNVTGALHMAHAFQHTLMDALVRRRRMQGYDALWLPGMDHAGISTQTVVERELAKEGLSRHDLGREAFVERVWQWKESYGGQILGQMRRLGDGVDWTRERFTLDEGLSRAVRTVFVRMFHEGLIYRAERIINWCPRCLTALSDIEVESSDDEGELVSIAYGPVTVATTRVETMLGDTAVAVHPDDERYRHLVGTDVELPLTGRRIPIVADEHVDPEFGTGAVKVTPAHDPNDFEIGQRHGLPAITVLDERGVITAHGPFEGMDRFEARPAITQALREMGLIRAETRPYLHAVPHCERCKTVVEPRLSLQWFVAVQTLAKQAGDAVREGRMTFVPARMADRYFGWVDNMHDWCISRQLWWGHRIPVWYCPNGHPTVPMPGAEMVDPAACGTCGRRDLVRDPDVLDTWFSSGLWPFSTLGWPEDTPDLRRYYPTDVLVTGYDIIFFWVARMMMFAAYAMDDVPFRTTFIHGLIRDAHGKKMSKSWGNVIDPLDWLDAYGADALRFTLARAANPGTDAPVSEEWVQGSRNFTNKLWNATRFALLNGADPHAPFPGPEARSAADRWVLSRLTAVIGEVDAGFEDFEFAKVCDTLFHFAWDEVFDWYVEQSKVSLAAGGETAATTRAVLGHVFDRLLRLLHPIVPFVTETLWTVLTGGETVVTAAWPSPDDALLDPDAEREMSRLQEVVTEVRRVRAEQRIRPTLTLPATVAADGSGWLDPFRQQVAALARVSGLQLVAAPPEGALAVAAGGLTLWLHTSDTVDTEAERGRLNRDRQAAEKERAQVRAKLDNPDFVTKAPAPVVVKMRSRLAAAEADLARITERLRGLDQR
jgi:valyl-tRNA synthetase